MQVVVMAGGLGTRLRPLTLEQPKPLLPVANRPILEHLLRLLASQGFHRVTLALHHKAQAIVGFVGDGKSFGVEVDYGLEGTPLGTAGGVKRAVRGRRSTLVLSGDLVADIDLRALVAAHQHGGAAATIVVSSCDNPQDFGAVECTADGRVEGFREKAESRRPGPCRVNAGVYVLDSAVWEVVPDDEPFDFGYQLFPLLLKGGWPVRAWETDGYWCDAGTPERLLDANVAVLDGALRWLPPGSRRQGTAWLEHGAYLHPAAVADASLLGQGAWVGAGARLKRTVVGPGAWVGAQAEVRDSLLLAGARVAPGSRVERSIIGPRGDLWPWSARPQHLARGA